MKAGNYCIIKTSIRKRSEKKVSLNCMRLEIICHSNVVETQSMAFDETSDSNSICFSSATAGDSVWEFWLSSFRMLFESSKLILQWRLHSSSLLVLASNLKKSWMNESERRNEEEIIDWRSDSEHFFCRSRCCFKAYFSFKWLSFAGS